MRVASGRLRGWIAACLVAVGYFALSRIGLAFVAEPEQIAVLWPAGGLAFAVLLRAAPQDRGLLVAAIFAGNLAAQLMSRSSVGVSVVLAAVNALEPLLAVGLVRAAERRAPAGPPPPVRASQSLFVAAIVAATAAGAVGALTVTIAYGAPFLSGWLTWALADGLGLLVVAPVLLDLADWRRHEPEGRRAWLLVGVALVIAFLVFVQPVGEGPAILEFPYAVFPAALWVAVRGGPRTTAVTVLAVSSIAALATLQDRGPFARADLDSLEQIVVVQGFIAVLVLSMALVGAIVAERARAEQRALQEAERFGSVLRAATESAIVATTTTGEITVFNEGAERLLGRRVADVSCRPLLDLHDPGEVAARAAELGVAPGWEVLVHAARRGEPETRDWTWRRVDDTPVTVSLTVTAMRDPDATLRGFIGIAHDVTALRAAERELRASAERQRLLLSSIPDAVIGLFDRDLRCVALEGRALDPRVDRGVVIGRPLEDVVPPDRLQILRPLYAGALEGRSASVEYTAAMTGQILELEVSPLMGAGDRPEGVFVFMRDVTERRHQERAVRRAEADLRAIFDSAAIAQFVLGADDTVEQANAALGRLVGTAPEAPRHLDEIVDADDVGRLVERVAAIRRGEDTAADLEIRCRDRGGDDIRATVHASRLEGDRVLVQVVDVTERRRYEAQLQHMAEHDALTGLVNRRRFGEELDRHVERVARYGSDGAVIVLDIDHFKQVNDTLGHNAGDDLIVSVAALLRDRLRTSDVLARLGGDEFAVLLPRAGRRQAERVAADLVRAVRDGAAHLPGTRRRRLSASAGVTMVVQREGLIGEELLVEADLAMYDAKDAGRDRYAFFSDDQHVEARTKARLSWVDRIEDAIAGERFALVAQPIQDLRTGEIRHHELLLRMLDDHDEHIPPGAFLYVAERYGLVSRIDRWVARAAVALLAELEAAGAPTCLEVNVSGQSLGDPALVRCIEEEVQRTGVDPRNLIFEITETAAVADIRLARAFAERLASLGCRFALDDFGAGFGSFYYLKHLPFDFLKIDGEFVRSCATNHDDQLVITALVQIARGMGKQTIAEFVTDEDVRRRLVALGVDYAQGMRIGPAIPLDAAFPAHRSHQRAV